MYVHIVYIVKHIGHFEACNKKQKLYSKRDIFLNDDWADVGVLDIQKCSNKTMHLYFFCIPVLSVTNAAAMCIVFVGRISIIILIYHLYANRLNKKCTIYGLSGLWFFHWSVRKPPCCLLSLVKDKWRTDA